MCTLSTNCKYDLIFSCSKLLIAKYVKAIFRKQIYTLKKRNIYNIYLRNRIRYWPKTLTDTVSPATFAKKSTNKSLLTNIEKFKRLDWMLWHRFWSATQASVLEDTMTEKICTFDFQWIFIERDEWTCVVDAFNGISLLLHNVKKHYVQLKIYNIFSISVL